MQTKLLLFDFDGTIADSFPLLKEVVNGLADKHHYKKVTDAEIEILKSKGAKEIIKALGMTWWRMPFIARDLKKETNKIITKVPLISGIKEVLIELKKRNYKIVILTSNAANNVRDFLKHNNMEENIDDIFGDVGLFNKAVIIKKAINKSGFALKDCWYIGDEIRDTEAAKKVGIKIISVTWGFNSKQKLLSLKPDAMIDSPKELVHLL